MKIKAEYKPEDFRRVINGIPVPNVPRWIPFSEKVAMLIWRYRWWRRPPGQG